MTGDQLILTTGGYVTLKAGECTLETGAPHLIGVLKVPLNYGEVRHCHQDHFLQTLQHMWPRFLLHASHHPGFPPQGLLPQESHPLWVLEGTPLYGQGR